MKMKKIIKALIRATTSRHWRCHKRKVFFQNLLEETRPFLNCSDGDYLDLCHDMAASIPFYPTDKETEICFKKFTGKCSQTLVAHITRVSPVIWKTKHRVTLKDDEIIVIQYEK